MKHRVLILGGSGMLGHKLYQVLSQFNDTYVTFRSFDRNTLSTGIFERNRVIDGVDVVDFQTVEHAILSVRPTIVINCVGIIKQLKAAKDYKKSIYVNALFPHLLNDICTNLGVKLILISTDCVFSGEKGNYCEADISDAADLYGRTKFLGEVSNSETLTLRTSIIGHELFTSTSLVDWFLSKQGEEISGYVNAIYSGLPTIVFSYELARLIAIENLPSGLLHISSEPISKYDLLSLLNETYNNRTKINRDISFKCNRSLNSSKYRTATNFNPDSWPSMIKEMYSDFIKSKYGEYKIYES